MTGDITRCWLASRQSLGQKQDLGGQTQAFAKLAIALRITIRKIAISLAKCDWRALKITPAPNKPIF